MVNLQSFIAGQRFGAPQFGILDAGIGVMDARARAQEAQFRSELQPLLKQQLQANVDLQAAQASRQKQSAAFLAEAMERASTNRAKEAERRAANEKVARSKLGQMAGGGAGLTVVQEEAFAEGYASAIDAGLSEQDATTFAASRVGLTAGDVEGFLDAGFVGPRQFTEGAFPELMRRPDPLGFPLPEAAVDVEAVRSLMNLSPIKDISMQAISPSRAGFLSRMEPSSDAAEYMMGGGRGVVPLGIPVNEGPGLFAPILEALGITSAVDSFLDQANMITRRRPVSPTP